MEPIRAWLPAQWHLLAVLNLLHVDALLNFPRHTDDRIQSTEYEELSGAYSYHNDLMLFIHPDLTNPD